VSDIPTDPGAYADVVEHTYEPPQRAEPTPFRLVDINMSKAAPPPDNEPDESGYAPHSEVTLVHIEWEDGRVTKIGYGGPETIETT
jgi:hypothetical protein